MEAYPKELKFTKTHEWVREDRDGLMVVGISHYAQSHLGEVIYVELPDCDQVVQASDEVAVVESVKAASDIYAPVSGIVVSVNEQLEEASGLVNSDPYGDGWLFKIQADDIAEYDALLDSESYAAEVEEA